jgi:hypothetical protein
MCLPEMVYAHERSWSEGNRPVRVGAYSDDHLADTVAMAFGGCATVVMRRR